MEMLPSDKYLASLLGITEEEYLEFKYYVQEEYEKAPAPSVVCGVETIIAVAQLVIGVGLLIAGELLKPKPPTQKSPGQPEQKTVEGKQIVRNTDFAPRYGFDSTQGVTALGATIPVVYAHREAVSGTYYGGVRINMPLLWSQTLSLYGSQMFRGIFLLGEGFGDASNVSADQRVDPDNYAVGSTVLQNFFFTTAINSVAARATIYLSRNGGRLKDSDRVKGRDKNSDPGNSGVNNDVYQIYWNGSTKTDFCASYRPDSQTVFGVYSPIGNGLTHRVNPNIRPGVRSVYQPVDDRMRVECPCDGTQMNMRDKYRCCFVTRSGITNGGTNGIAIGGVDESGSVSTRRLYSFTPDDTITYKLFTTSELMPRNNSDNSANYDDQQIFNAWTGKDNEGNDSEDHGGFAEPYADGDDGEGDNELNYGTEATCEDVSQVIAGKQATWDDSLIEGEKYKIGETIAVCVKRTPERFVSTAERLNDNNNNPIVQEVEAKFTVIEGGRCGVYTQNLLQGYEKNQVLNEAHSGFDVNKIGTDLRIVASGGYNGLDQEPENFVGGHILRYAEAFISSSRPVDAMELSIRSAVGIRTSGLCDFSSADKYEDSDYRFCSKFSTATSEQITSIRTESNTVTAAVERYSFFRVHYKVGKNSWQQFAHFIGVKGETQQNQFNYIRIELPAKSKLRVKLEPVSSFEIRAKFDLDAGPFLPMYVLNSNFIHAGNGDERDPITLTGAGSVKLVFHGEAMELARLPFQFWLGRNLKDLNQTKYDYRWAPGGSNVELYGLPLTDKGNYVDSWGKLAEFFPYTEITSSAESGPEHEVVAVNEIVKNAAVPNYDNMATAGLNIYSSTEFTQLPQFSAFVLGGRKCRLLLDGDSLAVEGCSHLFPDILLDLMTNKRYGAGEYISDEMIDIDSFRTAATYCQGRRYFFDGAIAETTNLRTWAADHANMHMLQFGERDGKFFLQKAFPDNIAIKNNFSAGNIVEDSFEFQYLNPEDRDSIRVSVLYREEDEGIGDNGGRFPITREVLVSETAYTNAGTPIENMDMSAFCTNRQHAIDAAKYMIRARRLTDHIIKFKTTHQAVLTELYPGDYIKVSMDYTAYNAFNNGIVSPDGTVVSTVPLEPGTYEVIGWYTDSEDEPVTMDLVIAEDGTSTQVNLLFTSVEKSTQVRTYLVERITTEEDGAFSVEASHAPTTAAGQLQMTEGFYTNNGWTITP